VHSNASFLASSIVGVNSQSVLEWMADNEAALTDTQREQIKALVDADANASGTGASAAGQCKCSFSTTVHEGVSRAVSHVRDPLCCVVLPHQRVWLQPPPTGGSTSSGS